MKAPFHVLFSNDTTNINTCSSPYSPARTWVMNKKTGKEEYIAPPFNEAMLEATVDETANTGVDVHLLQPGVGWVPWWKSKAYPFDEHVRFMKEQTGMDPSANSYAQYMANGGDMVEVFCRRCREKGPAPFVSFRLNDSHGHEFLAMQREEIPSWAWHVFSPVHVEHPEWRLGDDIRNWNTRVLNWAIPDVREAKFAFIKEIIEQYDIDGFELDFLRHCNFFDAETTTGEERRGIMNRFVQAVRRELDERDRADGRHRWLCVRIPAQVACYDPLGIDPAGMVAAGVEMFNLSNYYYTEHRGDFARFRELVGNEVSVYFEMCHTVHQRKPDPTLRYDCTIQRRTTPLQYYTGAHLAYSRGCDGCSTFNFVYYREHGTGQRGPASEPPFEIHKGIGDSAFCAKQPQHYIMSEGWNALGLDGTPLPATVRAGEALNVRQDLAPPEEGWQKGGRLRIQAEGDLGDSTWSAKLNGVALDGTGDRSEPYENPYPQLMGEPGEHRAWLVPTEVLKDGVNEIEVSLVEGIEQARISFLDMALS